MPTWFEGRRYYRRLCEKKITWSFSRGGCRFEPGHTGPCKPGRHR